MNDKITFLLDKNAIQEVIYTYCRGVDRCDPDIVKTAYHSDAHDDHGYWRGNAHDFADFVVRRLKDANITTTHCVTNTMIEVSGNEAWAESQIMATLLRRNTTPLKVDVIGARYLDTFSKRQGQWKISHRVVCLDWHKVETWPEPDLPIDTSKFLWGSRDRNDPVYEMILKGQLPKRV